MIQALSNFQLCFVRYVEWAPVDVILQGEASGWRTMLKDVQHRIFT